MAAILAVWRPEQSTTLLEKVTHSMDPRVGKLKKCHDRSLL